MTVEVSEQNELGMKVRITGRVTSTNADELFAKLSDLTAQNPGVKMIYDLDELEMISSAGLRVFLKLKKAGTECELINASAEVYEVFDITGFVEILDIKKAYRKMSVDGCVKIGEGAKGIVYKIDDETIIKVYKDPDCMNDIIKERECARKALVMGVPTAIPFDIVLVGSSFGSVFELVAAKSVTSTIIADPANAEEVISEYAAVMKEMHSVVDDGMFGIELPRIRDEVRVWAEFAKDYVSSETYEKILQFADGVEDTDTMLHGDGHPNNVMCTRDGQIFIDMDTLCVGDPRADIAVVYTALIGYKVVDPGNDFIPMGLEESEKIWKIFLKAYLKNESKEYLDEVELWAKRFTYLRLFRRGVRKETDKPHFAEYAKRELEAAFA